MPARIPTRADTESPERSSTFFVRLMGTHRPRDRGKLNLCIPHLDRASVAPSRCAIPIDLEAATIGMVTEKLECGEQAVPAVEDLHRRTEKDGEHGKTPFLAQQIE
jgi:hypothetical protein